jgi:hypothetical protein
LLEKRLQRAAIAVFGGVTLPVYPVKSGDIPLHLVYGYGHE